jgi:hypothetical protein
MTVLRFGSRGEAVRAVQEALQIPVDGHYGNITELAVKAFQVMHGLTVDGVVGPLTLAALDARVDRTNAVTPAPIEPDIHSRPAHVTFPKDTMAAKTAFYGDPRGLTGVNQSWYGANVIRVTPPYRMTFDGQPVKGIAFHKKAAPALLAALNQIWESCDQDQKKIEKYGLQEFGGSFNYRTIRGSSNLSNHSFAIAIDIAPTGNELGKTKGTMPAFAVKAFDDQGFRWGGRYKGRKDWMHFEAVTG